MVSPFRRPVFTPRPRLPSGKRRRPKFRNGPGNLDLSRWVVVRIAKPCAANDKHSMLASDLRNVLEELYNAGAYRVPADELYWPQELHPAVFRALNMQYITRREVDDGRVEFSLTQAGYQAINAEVPWSDILRRRLRDFFRFGKSR